MLLASRTPTLIPYTTLFRSIFHGDGSANLTATAFASLGAANGCSLSKVTTTATAIQVGDRVLCKTTWYVNGSQYQISDGTTLLATGKFQIGRASCRERALISEPAA